MTLIELVSWLYMLTNSVRVFAYFPQIISAWHATPENARALSRTTWAMFSISHLTTTLYGYVVMQDTVFTTVSTANLLCTTAVLVLIIRRQAGAAPLPLMHSTVPSPASR